MTSDWQDACDPVPARRDDAQPATKRERMIAERQLRRIRRKKFKPSTLGTAWPDFDEMGE